VNSEQLGRGFRGEDLGLDVRRICCHVYKAAHVFSAVLVGWEPASAQAQPKCATILGGAADDTGVASHSFERDFDTDL
jgi:hypothetical protein